MNFLKPVFLCLLVVTAAFPAWREVRSDDQSPPVVPTHSAGTDGCHFDSATFSDKGFLQGRRYLDRMSVHLPTDQILRRYYSETLAVIPALMFSPIAIQFAFAETVNSPIDEHGNTLLHVASRSGDVFAAWQLLEFGADPKISNRFLKLPAHVVCMKVPQVTDALTAAFSSHQDAITEVLFRRTDSDTPVVTEPVSTQRTTETSATAGFTLGVISR